MDAQERWKPIIGYVRYEVSDCGRVRRLDSGRLLNPWPHSGYMRVQLYNDKCRKSIRVHQLVAAAFIGQCPDGKEVNHIDGVKDNNRLDNLEYLTHLENIHHAVECGLCLRGESKPNVKLTEEGGRRMKIGQRIAKARKAKGWTQEDLAREMGYANTNSIWRLEHGKHTHDVPSSRVLMALERALDVRLVK